MNYKRGRIWVVLLLLALTFTWTVAQDNTTMGNATVVGDSNSEALQVVQNYLQSHDPNLLAEDAQFFDRTYAEPLVGRGSIETQDELFGPAFTNVAIDPLRFVVADSTVVAEYQFQGTNAGPYRANEATNMNVSFPVVSIFQVENGQITDVQRYYDAQAVNMQLGYAPYAGTAFGSAPVAEPVVTEETISNVADYPDQFYNREVTIDGLVGEGVGAHGFILYERDLLGTDDVLVIDRSEQRTDFIQLPDVRVRVSGTVQQFDLANLESDLGVDLDDATYSDITNRYGENLPVLLADSITNLDHVSYIQNILDNPEAFSGKQVGFGGRVGEAVSNQAGFIYEDALVDADRILVIGSSADVFDFTTMDDQLVEVNGTVRNFVLTDIENEFGLDLDDNLFADYQGPVVVADSITPVES